MLDNRAYSCANQAITPFGKLHLQTRMVQTMGQSSVFLSADSTWRRKHKVVARDPLRALPKCWQHVTPSHVRAISSRCSATGLEPAAFAESLLHVPGGTGGTDNGRGLKASDSTARVCGEQHLR